nr:putative beta 3 proteasome subunit (pb3) [Polytomella parva]|eukprot:CAMPEP_0175066626 /NCGR_PEP_ID=MMETSP0052_2-20121109/16622_1 /TAXON_ID=51329 ORGANISM="Polytomella parva, Strain SAG 63-3" /NCGR_SAMPLE_ID=MMETSP0052_2 /ASSEMBLY_ACC=CAM_ASM_000194 /LENGTH=191 /DNA_ID=CAMNT_0016333367 /DNA_START=297 /DNA_END=875 /DNA_ORIENTATION=+
MAGKNCVAIASDLRFGVQLQTITCDSSKVFKVHDKLYLGIGGLQTDALTLFQKVKFRTNMYKLREEKDIKPSKFGELLANMLYERRFGPFFTSPVVAGLEADGKPYICGYDSIGCLEKAEDFLISGTSPESLFGVCESFWKPDMSSDELFECISQCLLAGVGRDALAGWGSVVHIITPDQVTSRTLKGRMD